SPVPVIILLIQILVLTLRASPLVVICLFKGSWYTSFKLSDTLYSVSISKRSEGCFALFFISSISSDMASNGYNSILYRPLLLLIVFASRNNRVLSYIAVSMLIPSANLLYIFLKRFCISLLCSASMYHVHIIT